MTRQTSFLFGTATLLAATCFSVAGVHLITQSEIGPGFPTVTFNFLGNNVPNGPAALSYTEAGATFTGPLYSTSISSVAGSGRWLATSSAAYSVAFPDAVTKIGWQEFYGDIRSITLFADVQGLQSLGTFDISTTFPRDQLRFHGFASDAEFRRMSVATLRSDAYINDLRYTPEPTAFLSACAGGLAIAVRGMFVRRRA